MILYVFKFGLLFPFSFSSGVLVFSKFWAFFSFVNVFFFVGLTIFKSVVWAEDLHDWISFVFHTPSLIIVVVLMTHILSLKSKIKYINSFLNLIKRDLRLSDEFKILTRKIYLFLFLNFILWTTFFSEIYLFPNSFLSDPVYFPVFYILTAMIINIGSQYHFFVSTTGHLLKILTKDISSKKYLETTTRLFANILYVSEHLAETYSPQILLIVTLIFTLLINNVYLVISGATDVGNLGVKAAWGFLMSCVGLAIVIPCETVKHQAKEFNVLLYQVLISDSTSSLVHNKKLVLHVLMRREIVFTACGFFNIDHTLIHSIIASVTTYLIILIQFGKG